MSLPPEHITLRRKRSVDPLEALYIQDETRSGKRQRSGATAYFYARIEHQTVYRASSLPFLPPATHATVPKVLTADIEENENNHKSTSTDRKLNPQASSGNVFKASSPLFQDLAKKPDKANPHLRSLAQLRAYRLARQSSDQLITLPNLNGGIQKKRRRPDIPLFVEKAASKLKADVERQSVLDSVGRINDVIPQRVEDSLRERQKRPISNAAEKRWRSKNWTGKDDPVQRDSKEASETVIVDKAATGDHGNTFQLAQEMNRFAIDELKHQRDNGVESPRSQLKYQPKPPRPRQEQLLHHQISNSDDLPIEQAHEHSPAEYIYDTFIRRPLPSGIVDHIDIVRSLSDSGAEKCGLLVIDAADEELWELYAADESDDAGTSDDEDENAEDFYGNDYPEDEVDSDDEHDRGAYQYRQGASDDEEFDTNDDEGTWSDDELVKRLPWERKG
ncbi:hypothetical protein MMC25_004232 [Agyrium rufum]|nr:hypothetical protein [Agyrium rufum]